MHNLREAHLQAHTRSHLPNPDRPFECLEDGSSRKFRAVQHLKVHEPTHKGEKLWKVVSDLNPPLGCSLNGLSSVQERVVCRLVQNTTLERTPPQCIRLHGRNCIGTNDRIAQSHLLRIRSYRLTGKPTTRSCTLARIRPAFRCPPCRFSPPG